MPKSEKLELLYQLYEKPFYHIAYTILNHHQQAEDAVSDAFFQVMKHLDRIGEPDSPSTKAYMIKIIKHTAINQYRKNVRQNQYCTELNDTVFQVADSHDELESRFKKTSLRQMLSEMFSLVSETDKKIILLHCQENKSFKEIADMFNMKEATVRKRFERARKRMTAQKGEDFYASNQ
ncbi:MAG: sigma-70 family RNA polymerase sigma factor [Oscillospiraceae bacterium]|nr:sigma-70 family RNA polymerase sigma factor [Oscillospiraceae bacterium]